MTEHSKKPQQNQTVEIFSSFPFFASENKFVFSFSPAIFNLECVLLLSERFGMYTEKGKTRKKESHFASRHAHNRRPLLILGGKHSNFPSKTSRFPTNFAIVCVCGIQHFHLLAMTQLDSTRNTWNICKRTTSSEENSSAVWLNVSFSFGKRSRGKETTRFSPTVSCLERKNQQIVMSKQGKHQEGNRTGRSTKAA